MATKKKNSAKPAKADTNNDGIIDAADVSAAGIVPEEIETRSRGRQPKELGIEDLQNKVKELMVMNQQFIKQQNAKGKSIDRFYFAGQQLERLLKNQFVY